jgi:hypothetical protein
MDDLIRAAILQKRLIAFDYQGLPRIAEPHVYGRHDGRDQVLVYQVGGESRSGGIPNWRRVDLGQIADLQLLDERFPGQRAAPSGKHSEWDEIYLIVE